MNGFTLGSLLLLSLSSYAVRADIPILPVEAVQLAAIGSTAELRCGVDLTRIDRAAVDDIFWEKSSKDLISKIEANTDKYIFRYEETDHYYSVWLVIMNVQESDAIEYICNVETDDNDLEFRSVKIQIKYESNGAEIPAEPISEDFAIKSTYNSDLESNEKHRKPITVPYWLAGN